MIRLYNIGPNSLLHNYGSDSYSFCC